MRHARRAGLVDVGAGVAREEADQPEPDRPAVLEEEEQREQRQDDAGEDLADGGGGGRARRWRACPGCRSASLLRAVDGVVELALGRPSVRDDRASPGPARCPR